ncbi:DGQHR domain-containing protein [Paenibacillus brasilensis]|uniref:DGQHR domain-containing protein n=1 Tax=Paenibacillus brasilensis TaxID=128574 RepID=A0ABU0KSI4_9BACL|nr:DGQHR domain-containing protein [Paenibacillus brasilensis]MDQ0492396.1 DGQHR domain-containing protein [Paenibacillus brasilensis]
MEIKQEKGLAAIQVTQGKYKFYIVSMPSETLRETCFTITREDDPIKGFQRRLDETRADEISQYIDGGVGSIPTAIILSAQDEANLEYHSRNKTISFTPEKNSFLIIDGQHRVWGFIKAKTSIRVPVVIYEDLTRVEEAQLFVDINSTQKEVPRDLILDVKRLLQKESEEEKRCSQIFEFFYSKEGSILNGHLARAERENGKITRRIFNNCISELLSDMLEEISDDDSYIIINNYLSAMKSVLGSIDSNGDDIITRITVFQACMGVSKYVIEKTNNMFGGRLTVDSFTETLSILKTNLPRGVVQRPGNSYRKLSDHLMNALTKVSLRPGVISLE